ncbi:MAG: C4-type zinc ribbon domain-containing protein [Endomicrobium sp.]|jgi:predicted  nucleic acid-binding Zn-ribbon protein|nr:C4-type zinc ribbon domain-containing protein [Endomicrobium sp.]
MEKLKQDLELLYELQNYDIKIDNVKEKIEKTLALIKEKKEILEDKKAEIYLKKKKFLELSSMKKEKDAVLDSKEKAISKHSMELNTVKSNNTYKALLLEIEKAKADKNVIEDEILGLMDEIDKESIVMKFVENEFKELEQKVKSEISEIENFAEKLKEEIIKVEKEREEYKLKVNKMILTHYERLRECHYGQGVCLVEDESCSGCGMVLRPQLINQAQKCQELVFCDNCSRILLKR